MAERRRLLATAATSAVVLAGALPAHASMVTVVDGERALARDDPLMPAPRLTEEGGQVARSLPRTSAPLARFSRSGRGRRAVARALRTALRTRRIDVASYRRYLSIYRRGRSTLRRLRGVRGRQLRYVVGVLDRLAVTRRLIPSRMPAVFLELRRNAQYWARLAPPGARDDVIFRGSEIVFRYFPGEGLHIHPLATFVRANLMYGACERVTTAPCRREGLTHLLDEMSGLAVNRSPRFTAWEYLFHFGGGSPPWMSGMAQATGIQALARGARLLGRPDYLETARSALGAFETPPPEGVRARGFTGGVHYLQYSFAPRLYIFNAFTQSLLGLYDYGQISADPRAEQLFAEAEPELRREIPHSDIGDWSRYSYRGRESDRSYHELLREVLQNMCSRRLGDPYCFYARRYRDDQTQPPVIDLRAPPSAREERLVPVGFGLSKLSAVELTIAKGGRVTFHRIATFRRGGRRFLWRPRSPGTYEIRLGAKELRTGRGLKGRASGAIEVADDPER